MTKPPLITLDELRRRAVEWKAPPTNPDAYGEVGRLLSHIGDLKEVIDYLQDRADGWETECRMAVEVAYNRGAVEWAEMNYPQWIEWLRQQNAPKA